MRGSSRILLATAAALVVATTLAGCVPAEPRYEYAPHHTEHLPLDHLRLRVPPLVPERFCQIARTAQRLCAGGR